MTGGQAIHVGPDDAAAAGKGRPRALALAFQFLAQIKVGSLTVAMPDGQHLRFGGHEDGPDAHISLHSHDLAHRALKRGQIGVAESYLAGHWTTPDLTAFIELFCRNPDLIDELLEDRPLVRLVYNLSHWLNRNTRRGSKRNIEAHYDLGNTFYARWLDPSMTYSSALFGDKTDDLDAAQAEKYRSLAEKIALSPDCHVLEVGCGWGGFAEFAAKDVGARVTGITISQEQHDFAKERIFKAGLADKVDIRLEDYRDTEGTYDRIASIEMFEAVGEEYWPAYFAMLRDRLRTDGRAGLQVITIQDEMFDVYRREPDFIQKYIFPGGMLPSPSALKAVADKAGLSLDREKVFGLDYARTLAIWRDRFTAAWPDIKGLGFDERFRRLWEFYLSYCEAGFRSGNIDVRQIVYVRS